MKRWLLAAALLAGAACDSQRDAAAPQRTVDPALTAALTQIDRCRGHWSDAVFSAFCTALALAGASHP